MSEVPESLTFEQAAAITGYATRYLRRLEKRGLLRTFAGEQVVRRKQAARLILRSELEKLPRWKNRQATDEG